MSPSFPGRARPLLPRPLSHADPHLSQAQIHANQHIREATPAWPLARDADANADHDFAHALDERTLAASRKRAAERLRRREDDSNNSSGGELMAKIKQFVVAFMRSKGQGDKVVGLRSVDVDEAPVLKPKRTMRYYFSS